MSLKQLFFLAQVLLLYCGAFSQGATSSSIPRIIPPSPNAATLGKFGDIPVSTYTGTSSISVPFYNIKTKSISVPVSIDYHTGGIRLADEAGLVGLGWALNAGGMISRTINDKDDFTEHYFTANNGSLALFPEIKGKLIPHIFSYDPGEAGVWGYNFICDYKVYSEAGTTNYFQNIINLGLYDMEPDTYNFNFPGGSGKFIIGRDGKIVLQKQENVRIEFASDGSTFTITDDHGNKFYFLDKEYSQPAMGGALHISSWLLSKIVTQQKDSVMFTYVSDNSWTTVKGIFHETLRTGVSNFETPIYSNDPGQKYLNKVLQNIDWVNGQIQFVYDTKRADLENGKKLNAVKVYAKNLSGLQYLKQTNLYYSYFNNTFLDSLEFRRLRLDSVQDISGSDTVPPYTFFYNMPANNQNLMGKHYSSADHWGYFNGKTNAVGGDYKKGFTPSFVGIVSIGNPGAVISQYLSLSGADREADFTYMQSFSLKQVSYPTGGYTQLEYEPNYYDFNNSKSGPDGKDLEYIKTVSKTIDVKVNNNGTFTGTVDFSGIYLTSGFISNANLTVSFRAASSDSLNRYHNNLGYGKINFTFQGNTTDISDQNLFCSGTMSGNNCSGTVYSTSIPLVISSPTSYTWSAYIDPRVKISGGFMEITATFTFLEPLYRNATMMLAGGLRIKSITDYSAPNVIAKKRLYDYGYVKDGNGDGTNETYSYGRLMGYLSYARHEKLRSGSGNGISLTRYSSNFSSFTSLSSGNIVGYDQVTEYTVDASNSDIGKTVYNYYNSSDTSFNYAGFRLPGVKNLPNNLNGILRSKAVYKRIGQSYSKVTESNYYYRTVNRVMYSCMKYLHMENSPENSPGGVIPCQYDNNGQPTSYACSCPFGKDSSGYQLFACFYPSISSEKVLLDSTVEKMYDQSDTNKIIITRSGNYYDNPKHYQPTRNKMTDSKSNTRVAFMRYPQDYIASGNYTGNNVLDSLIGRNMVAEAIEKRDSLYYAGSSTGYITGAQLSTYRFLNANVLGIDKQYQLFLSSPVINFQPFAINGSATSRDSRYSSAVSFDTYDNTYNIQQITTPDQPATSYIWDYNNQYPVAQVANATISQVAYTSFESDGKGNWNNYTGLVSNISIAPFPPTGNKYYNLTGSATLSKTSLTIGKKYIVSYWTKNSSAFTITGVSANTSIKGKTINDWTYFEHTITASQITVTISGLGVIDEVRLYPADAQMTTYTYQPLIGMTSSCDINNRITYYTYDAQGRLSYISDQDRYVLKKFCYNFYGEPVICNTATAQPSPGITLNVINAVSVSGFTARFTDVSNNSIVYAYILPATSGVLSPAIPAGTYQLSIFKLNNPTPYYYALNCGLYETGTSGNFSNVNVSAGNCTTITIDTINQP